MKNGTINNEETIRKIIALTNNPRYINATRKALINREQLTEDDVMFITAMAAGEAIKAIIPERQYKRLIIRLWPEEQREGSQGYFYEKNGKYVVTYEQGNKEFFMNRNYSFLKKIQCVFTFAHELYHAKQAIDAKDERITFDSFMYCLEAGLQGNVPGFYKKEYENLYMEASAEGIGIIMATDFLEKYGVLDELMNDPMLEEMGFKDKNKDQFRKFLMGAFKKNHHVFENDDELKEYIKKLLKILRDNIHTFSRKYDEDVFIKYPILKYLINPKTGELESPERLQELLDNTYMEKENSDTKDKRRLLKILKELSIERQQSFSQK